MPVLAPERPDQADEHDVAKRQFEDVVGGANSPEDHQTRESPDENAAVKRLREREAAGGGGNPREEAKRPVAAQEQEPERFKYKSGTEMYERGRENRRNGGGRGLFIGVGAGGGILSVVMGFVSLLPFKMPAILDLVNNYAGNQVEHIVEREAEKVMLRFILNGSNAAVGNGNVIATGNPLGDLFANLRVARFEDDLFKEFGMKIEQNGKGGISILHNGTNLGDFKNVDELEAFLNRNDLSYRDSKRAIKLLVREKIPVWRLVKRFKYAQYLRLKFIPHFGVGQKKTDETDEEFRERVRSIQVDDITTEQVERAGKLFECMADACDDLDERLAEQMKERAGSLDADALTDKLKDISAEVADDAGKEVVKESVEKVTKTVGTRFTAKIATAVGAGATTGGVLLAVDLMTTASNIDHFVREESENGKFIRQLANLRGAAMASFYSFFTGVADQEKASELPIDVAGDFGGQFDHITEGIAYNVMAFGKAQGVAMEQWRLTNRKLADSELVQAFSSMYSGPLVVARAQFIAWYYTVGWLWNHAGAWIGEAMGWIVENVPCVTIPAVIQCPKDMMVKVVQLIEPIWQAFSEWVGLTIDPLVNDPNAINVLAFGATEAFRGYCLEEMDCHEQTLADARESRQAIAAEKAEYNSGLSLGDRLFSLDNTDSLASALVRIVPSMSPSNGFGTLAFAGIRIAGSLPGNFGSLVSGRAQADDGVTVADLMGDPAVGVNESELDQPISPELLPGGSGQCPINNADGYNPCATQKIVLAAMNCDVSVVTLCPGAGPSEDEAAAANQEEFGLPDASAKQLAQMILDNKNITFEPGNDGAKHDIQVTANGQPVVACGRSRPLDTRLLQVLLSAAGNYTDPRSQKLIPSRYKFRINAIMSDHDCDGGFHPLGKAADLGWVNGVYAGPVNSSGNCTPSCGLKTPLYKEFATFIGNNLPPTGRIGQTQAACLGHLDIPKSIIQHADTCHHLHIAVGG